MSGRPPILPARTAREKEVVLGDEEAGAELRLGEFQHVTSLTHSEARLLIGAVLSSRARGNNANIPETEYERFFFYTILHVLVGFLPFNIMDGRFVFHSKSLKAA